MYHVFSTLQARIDMIGAACESAEKVIAETRKAYFSNRQGSTVIPTIDKVQAAKIQEQENLLRNAVNRGEGVLLQTLLVVLICRSGFIIFILDVQ